MADIAVIKNPSVEVKDLDVIPLEEIAKVLELGLKENFAQARVQVVDCPDLTQEPFHLAASGNVFKK